MVTAPSDCLIDDCHRVTGNQQLLTEMTAVHSRPAFSWHFLRKCLSDLKPLRTSIEMFFLLRYAVCLGQAAIHSNLPFNWSSTHLLIQIFIVWVSCHLSSDEASFRNAQEIWDEPLYVLAEWWRSENMLDGWLASFFRRVGTVTSSVAGKWVNLKARRV